MKKIVLDCRLISNQETGISRYSKEFIAIFVSLFGAKNISIILQNGVDFETDVKVYKTDLYPFSMKDFFKFHKFLKDIDFDIYHSLFHVNSFFKVKNKKYITTIHDIGYRFLDGYYAGKVPLADRFSFFNQVGVFYYDFMIGKSLKNSDFVISISEHTRDDVKNSFGYDSFVVTEGVNPIVDDMGDVSLPYEKNSFFLYVGNDRNNKNLEFLKEVYLESKTDKKLLMVGHSGKNIKKADKEIIYTGYVSDEELAQLYKDCSAFVFPSTYEGFGLPVLEAINFGAIVFSSNSASLKEFGEYNVHYFDPCDKNSLKKLLENVDKFEFDELKRDVLFKKFSWQKAKEQVKSMYEKVLDE